MNATAHEIPFLTIFATVFHGHFTYEQEYRF